MHKPESVKSALAQTVVILEDVDSIYAFEQSKKLAIKLDVEHHTVPPTKHKHGFKQGKWHLVFTDKGLVLRVASEPSWSDIFVDFQSSALSYRQQHGGGKNEAIAKAIGMKGKTSLRVLDCTAGMGVDSFVMASVGAHVTMIERSPIIAALLEDALVRTQDHNLNLLGSLCLVEHDAAKYLNSLNNVKNSDHERFDVIYLDPMFPHKKKSALVKKEMQAFQLLLGPDQDSEALFSAAIDYAPARIVVKRPANAQPLENDQCIKPSTVIKSKKHRFDIYFINQP